MPNFLSYGYLELILTMLDEASTTEISKNVIKKDLKKIKISLNVGEELQEKPERIYKRFRPISYN